MRPLATKIWLAVFFCAATKKGRLNMQSTTIPTVDIKGTGARIDKLRKNAGLSVKDIQSILGLGSSQAVYKWLAGRCLPTIDNLVILSAVLNVKIDDIIVRS